jgi:hypothetical protein
MVSVSGEAGKNRENPAPLGAQISVPGWDVAVVEFLRGQDALEMINTKDWPAPSLPDGQEYVLAKVFVRSTSLSEGYQDLGISELFITGENCLSYGDTLDGWPQPEFLYENIFTAEAVEGWVDAVVPVDEKNLELVLDLTEDETRVTRYFELDDGASISLPTELENLSENEIGISMDNPASIGDQIITPDWSLLITEQVRGTEAEALLQKDNPYYTAPTTGWENVLLHVVMKYISRDEMPSRISSDNFYAVDHSGYMLSYGYIYTPATSAWLGGTYLPGAEMDAWVAISIPQEMHPVLIEFDPDRYLYNSPDLNLRFIKIE